MKGNENTFVQEYFSGTFIVNCWYAAPKQTESVKDLSVQTNFQCSSGCWENRSVCTKSKEKWKFMLISTISEALDTLINHLAIPSILYVSSWSTLMLMKLVLGLYCIFIYTESRQSRNCARRNYSAQKYNVLLCYGCLETGLPAEEVLHSGNGSPEPQLGA